ncbi:MAG: aminotransferase class V-fold PLP-dependent enzyme [Clostridium sp.]|uniref:aminotransferase class V-fold PLP-dependent enzyme n=1 Tax=Clostridium sp. TaxID=1506 RepID=UPI00302E95C8
MKKIYLDNGATSFPKPTEVIESMTNYIVGIGGNVNRGSYDSSFDAENTIYETRELLCELFNFSKPENVIFTRNITESLNVVLKGLLKRNDHVIVSSMEHNAVMRPLNSLKNKGVKYSVVPCDKDGNLNVDDIYKYIQPNTKAIIMTHSSNVCGTILPLYEIGTLCKNHNLHFIVDTAQTAGFLPIDMKQMNIDILCFTGHKSLLGPQGIGGFLISDALAKVTSPLIEGGTGSLSEYEIQPEYMPDKFEGGTLNIPGIFGLNASLKFLKETGIENLRAHECFLTQIFLDKLQDIKGLNIIGSLYAKNKTSVVSIDFLNIDNGEISYKLSKDYGISVRCGLHCAPSAHKTLGTFPDGTVRFSFGAFNTEDDVVYAIESIKEILSSYF